MQTFFFDMKDGVPLRDRIGIEFDTNVEAIKHCRVLAQHFRDCVQGTTLPLCDGDSGRRLIILPCKEAAIPQARSNRRQKARRAQLEAHDGNAWIS